MSSLFVPTVGFIDTENVQHTYTYNGDGTPATDSITVNGVTMTKTYTYITVTINGVSTKVVGSETDWVLQ